MIYPGISKMGECGLQVGTLEKESISGLWKAQFGP